jgi:hypothetical protein
MVRLVRVPAGGGTPQPVATPLMFPTILRFSPDGRLFTTNFSVDIAGEQPRGAILEVTLP